MVTLAEGTPVHGTAIVIGEASFLFTGPSGSGKTTTIKLLSRFYDVQSGSVTVSGIDVRDWNLQSLRRHIGLVLQDVFLFSGDVLTNISLRDSSVPLERIEQAAQSTNAARFIRKLPGEFSAQVRERGSNFSSGQRQLLAMARVLAYDPEILVLDEATSALDSEVEFREIGPFAVPSMVLSGRVGAETIRIYAVHPPPPLGARLTDARNDQLRELAAEISRDAGGNVLSDKQCTSEPQSVDVMAGEDYGGVASELFYEGN